MPEPASERSELASERPEPAFERLELVSDRPWLTSGGTDVRTDVWDVQISPVFYRTSSPPVPSGAAAQKEIETERLRDTHTRAHSGTNKHAHAPAHSHNCRLITFFCFKECGKKDGNEYIMFMRRTGRFQRDVWTSPYAQLNT